MITNTMNDQFKVIHREGKILERFDWENDKGSNSGFYIEWQGYEYRATMRNGEVVSLRKLWEV